MVKFLDTTLRDGEQTPGVALTPQDKLQIALALDELGVDIIELGSVATSEGERQAIQLISQQGLNAELCCFVRMLKQDLDLALKFDLDSIFLVVPSSDLHIRARLGREREFVLEKSAEFTDYAKQHGMLVELGAEDASRAELEFVLSLFRNASPDRACFCDTVGILVPQRIPQILEKLSSLEIPIAIHCHNDFGLATINTVTAALHGASELHVTVNGLGERAGNAPLEEVVLCLEQHYGIQTNIQKPKLYSISSLVSRLTKIPIPINKPVVGQNAFSHESGIHVHGLLKDFSTYEPYPPELVGRIRRIIYGKHTGRAAIQNALLELGFNLTQEQQDRVLEMVKQLGDRGRWVTDAELRAIAESIAQLPIQPKLKLKQFSVVTGSDIMPTASIRLDFEGREIMEASTGVGPVDAAINALLRALGHRLELVRYHVDAITGGTDAVVEVMIELKRGDKIVTARGVSEDIIKASVDAFVNGINLLL